MNWAMKFCLIHHIYLTSHQLTTTSSILIAFCRDNFHNQQEAEYTFKGLIKSYSIDFYATGINKLISHKFGKTVLAVMLPILTNKDAFEPSYNDLKFTV